MSERIIGREMDAREERLFFENASEDIRLMVDFISAAYGKAGMKAETAVRLAQRGVLSMCVMMGGVAYYSPAVESVEEYWGNHVGPDCPQLMTDVSRAYAVFSQSLVGEPDLPEKPEALARQAVLTIAEFFGGHTLYIPYGDAGFRAVRDAEIYRLVGKVSMKELGFRYRMSGVRISQIVKKQRELARQRCRQE